VQKAGRRLPFVDRVLVRVANRLCRPSSEHALAQWLESDFVCGRDGKRILARWKQQGRVWVDLNWLQEWYRTLDQLLFALDNKNAHPRLLVDGDGGSRFTLRLVTTLFGLGLVGLKIKSA
jgi:hypothetical protein